MEQVGTVLTLFSSNPKVNSSGRHSSFGHVIFTICNTKFVRYNIFWPVVCYFFQSQWQPKMASWGGWAGHAAPSAAGVRDPSLKAWSEFDFKSTYVLFSFGWNQEEARRLEVEIRQEGPDRKGRIPWRGYPWGRRRWNRLVHSWN